jgi:NADH-quinone oxidoreductase subunit N
MQQLTQDIPNQLSNVLGSLQYFTPEIYLTALFILVLLTDLFFGKNSTWLCRTIALIGMVMVLVMDYDQKLMMQKGTGIAIPVWQYAVAAWPGG